MCSCAIQLINIALLLIGSIVILLTGNKGGPEIVIF